jgi:hypothetical protein
VILTNNLCEFLFPLTFINEFFCTFQYNFRVPDFIFTHNRRNAESRWVKWWITPFHISIMLIIQSSLLNSSHTSSDHDYYFCVAFGSLYIILILFCNFTLLCFFSIFYIHIYTFFHALFKFNSVILYNLWVWGGSHEAQWVEQLSYS